MGATVLERSTTLHALVEVSSGVCVGVGVWKREHRNSCPSVAVPDRPPMTRLDSKVGDEQRKRGGGGQSAIESRVFKTPPHLLTPQPVKSDHFALSNPTKWRVWLKAIQNSQLLTLTPQTTTPPLLSLCFARP